MSVLCCALKGVRSSYTARVGKWGKKTTQYYSSLSATGGGSYFCTGQGERRRRRCAVIALASMYLVDGASTGELKEGAYWFCCWAQISTVFLLNVSPGWLTTPPLLKTKPCHTMPRSCNHTVCEGCRELASGLITYCNGNLFGHLMQSAVKWTSDLLV